MALDLSALEDGELAALSLAGRQAAFGEIVRRHRDPLFRLARSHTGDADEALDLVQETFLSAHRSLARYDPERPLRAWLSAIALNKCRDWGRRRTVRRFLTFARPLDEPAAAQVADPALGAEVEVDDRAALARVARAIAALPTRLKEVVILRAVEGLSQAETAALLRVTPKAVETRLHRARSRLAALLEADEG